MGGLLQRVLDVRRYEELLLNKQAIKRSMRVFKIIRPQGGLVQICYPLSIRHTQIPGPPQAINF